MACCQLAGPWPWAGAIGSAARVFIWAGGVGAARVTYLLEGVAEALFIQWMKILPVLLRTLLASADVIPFLKASFGALQLPQLSYPRVDRRCCCLLCCAYLCFVYFLALVCPSVFVVAAVIRFVGGCFAAVAAWVDAWPPRRLGLHAQSAAERVMALIADALS